MTSLEVAFKYILVEQRMKLSRFNDLNDPFELRCHDLGSTTLRPQSSAFVETANEKLGLICFSDNWHSPVMWAHYANKHQGICLGFDIADGFLGYVQYTETRLLWPTDEDDNDVRVIEQMLYNKATEWKYEREIRAIALLGKKKRPMYHIPFGKDMQLRELIIGAKSDISPRDIASLILPQATSVTIKKARAAFKKFEIVENRRYKPITIPARLDCATTHHKPPPDTRFILCPAHLRESK